jgi:hypothetical protein
MRRSLLRVGTVGLTVGVILLVTGAPASGDNCGSLADCLPGAKGLLAALAAVLIVAGLAALLFGGGALLAGALGGAGLGGGLALAGGGVTAAAGAISAAAAAELAAAGAVTVGAGVMVAEMAGKSGGGSSGSSGSSGAPREPTSANQMRQQVLRGNAPRSVDRVDADRKLPSGQYEEPHVHFKDGSALYRTGVWRHGSHELTNAEIKWLTSNGWRLPGG